METIVFKDSDLVQNSSSFLIGIAISDNEVVIGQDGLDEYGKRGFFCDKEFSDGRYLAAIDAGYSLEAFTDYFGQELLFLYKKNNRWAFSNCFLELACWARSEGLPLTLREEFLYYPLIKGSLFEQPYTDEVVYDEVVLIPSDKKLVFNKFDPQSIAVCDRASKLNNYANEEDALLDLVGFNSSLIPALSGSHQDNLIFELSGGQDSRMALAMCMPGLRGEKRVRVYSDESRTNEYHIAKSIVERSECGFDLAGSLKPIGDGSNKQELKKALYKSTIGVKYNSVRVPSRVSVPSLLRVNGAGGGNIRPFFSSSPLSFITRVERKQEAVSRGLLSKVKSKFIEQVKSLGLDSERDESFIPFYRRYRTRYLGGRNSYRSLFGQVITPLQSVRFLAAYDAYVKAGKTFSHLLSDILSFGGGPFLNTPFDSDSKSLPKEIMVSSELNFPKRLSFLLSKESYCFKIFGRLGQRERHHSHFSDGILNFIMDEEVSIAKSCPSQHLLNFERRSDRFKAVSFWALERLSS